MKWLVAAVLGLLAGVIAYEVLRKADDIYDPYAIPFGELIFE